MLPGTGIEPVSLDHESNELANYSIPTIPTAGFEPASCAPQSTYANHLHHVVNFNILQRNVSISERMRHIKQTQKPLKTTHQLVQIHDQKNIHLLQNKNFANY